MSFILKFICSFLHKPDEYNNPMKHFNTRQNLTLQRSLKKVIKLSFKTENLLKRFLQINKSYIYLIICLNNKIIIFLLHYLLYQ